MRGSARGKTPRGRGLKAPQQLHFGKIPLSRVGSAASALWDWLLPGRIPTRAWAGIISATEHPSAQPCCWNFLGKSFSLLFRAKSLLQDLVGLALYLSTQLSACAVNNSNPLSFREMGLCCFVISIHLILIFAFQLIPAVLKLLNINSPWFPLFPGRTIQTEPEAAALQGHSKQILTLKYLFKVKFPVSI